MNFWRSRHNSQLQLSAEEMLEISQNIRRKYAPSASDATPELVILPIDPNHLHAYWNLIDKLADPIQYNCADSQLTLRVYWHPDGAGERGEISASKLWFDIALHSIQQQCRVQVPIDAAAYSAVIGRRYVDRSFETIAHSNVVRVPRSKLTPPRSKTPSAPAAQPAEQRLLLPLPEIKTFPQPAGDILYDETLIDIKIHETLQHKNTTLPSPIIRNSRVVYDERRIDSMIRKTLFEKGFDESLGATPTPEVTLTKKPIIASDKTPSGRGNRQ